MTNRMVGVLLFDAGARFSEFDEIVKALTSLGYTLEVSNRPNEYDRKDWQLIITTLEPCNNDKATKTEDK